MVQDAVQGYNFSREKATLHPVIIHTYRYIWTEAHFLVTSWYM
jgi:hypothetical protein